MLCLRRILNILSCSSFISFHSMSFSASVIKFWDIRKHQSPVATITLTTDNDPSTPLPFGITSMSLSTDRTQILASSKTGRLYSIPWMQSDPQCVYYQGHAARSFFVRCDMSTRRDTDNSLLFACGSSDGRVYIYDVASECVCI